MFLQALSDTYFDSDPPPTPLDQLPTNKNSAQPIKSTAIDSLPPPKKSRL